MKNAILYFLMSIILISMVSVGESETIFLDFGKDESTNFPTNIKPNSQAIPTTLGAFSCNELDLNENQEGELINLIVTLVKEDFWNWDVKVVTTKPTSDDFIHIGVGSDGCPKEWVEVKGVAGPKGGQEEGQEEGQEKERWYGRVWAGEFNQLTSFSSIKEYANGIAGVISHEATHVITKNKNDIHINKNPRSPYIMQIRKIWRARISDQYFHEETITKLNNKLSKNQQVPIKMEAPNSEWSIWIDEYGRSHRLLYKYSENKYKDEMHEWAGYIQYTPENEEIVKGWLSDVFSYSEWLDKKFDEDEDILNDPDWPYAFPLGSKGIRSKIWNNTLDIEIQSWIFTWKLGEKEKYGLGQNYIFKNKSNKRLNDFVYYQYMDVDVFEEDDKGDDMENDYSDNSGVTIGDIKLGGMCILGKQGLTRGYVLDAPFSYPLPDCYWWKAKDNYTGNFPDGDEKYRVGTYKDIKQYIEGEESLSMNNEGDLAGTLRWSRWFKGRENGKRKLEPICLEPGQTLIISSAVYAVPEPCTMLLMGSGLAGLAGIARRRRRQQ